QTARSFAEADVEFHLAVGAASGNPMMRSVAAVIETALLASFSLSTPIQSEELHTRTVDAHEAIVDAIDKRDPKRAHAAMIEVIEEGNERIRTEAAAANRVSQRA